MKSPHTHTHTHTRTHIHVHTHAHPHTHTHTRARSQSASAIHAENQRLLLEVQHREQSFQMVFKRSPAVGKLNPLALSSTTRGSAQMAATAALTPLGHTLTGPLPHSAPASGPGRTQQNAGVPESPPRASSASSHGGAPNTPPTGVNLSSTAGRRLAPLPTSHQTHHTLSASLASQLANTLPAGLPPAIRKNMPREESITADIDTIDSP